jgi:hypothetical protein
MAFLGKLRVGALVCALLATGGFGQKLDEYQVKAAFVVNFASFVEWPATVFRGPEDAFTICVLGQDPFGHWLESLAQGKVVDGRGFVIRHVNDVLQVSGCQILFLCASDRLRFRSILTDLRSTTVLPVGDTSDFIAEGGVIGMRLDGGRIRIQINAAGAKERNLRVSAHLLSLAEKSKP